MKNFLVSMLLLCLMTTNARAQEIYNEVKSIMQNLEITKNDSKEV